MACIKEEIIGKYAKSKKRRKIVTTGIITLGIIILLIAALSYYGTNVGSFVIRLNNPEANDTLALSLDDYSDENVTLTSTTSRLAADPLKDCMDCQYSWVPENIYEGMGTKHGSMHGRQIYFAYTFYLLNLGNTPLNYDMTVNLLSVTRNLDEVLRIMVIEEDDFTNSKVFAKRQGANGQKPGDPELLYTEYDDGRGGLYLGETIPFINDTTIMKVSYKDFEARSQRRYTFVMWLDGWDAQETDDMLGGGLKLSMDFSVAD